MKHLLLLASLLCFSAMPARAADMAAAASGAKDAETCIEPLAQGDIKAFEACLKKLDAASQGAADVKSSYTVGLYFQSWSIANLIAAQADGDDFFPEIKKRSDAKPQRQLAMRLFDKFRALQKKLKIKDDDLAKSAGYELPAVKPHLDYYDKLPKK